MVSDAEPLRVLVVDDEQSIRLLLRRWVERSLDEAQVFEAEDGLQALEKITEDGVDIVITDLKMPVLSGTDLLTLLHADPRRSQMEVLVATQMAGEKTVCEAIQLGVSDYLLKPLQYDWVVQRIRGAASRLEERKKEAVDASDSSLPRLLLVDCDANFVHAAEAALAGRFAVKQATGAAAALVQALRFKPDAVAVSRQVPGLKLDFFAERLKRLPGREPPLILELIEPGETPSVDGVGSLLRTYVPEKLLKSVVEATGGVVEVEEGFCKSLAKDMATAVLQGFGMMAGEEPEPAAGDAPEAFEIRRSIRLTSESAEREVQLEIHCDNALDVDLVTAMLGQPPEDGEDSLAISEMLNVVAGRIKNACEERGMDFALGLPEALPDDADSPERLDKVETLYAWRGMKLLVRLSSRRLPAAA